MVSEFPYIRVLSNNGFTIIRKKINDREFKEKNQYYKNEKIIIASNLYVKLIEPLKKVL